MNNRLIWLILLLVFLPCHLAFGQGIFVGPDGKSSKQTLSLPYGFYNEKFGAAVAYVYGVMGYPQEQSLFVSTAMVGTREAAMGFLLGRDIRLPISDRLFLDPIVSIGYFGENESYSGGNPDFPDERAGSNNSDEDNFIEGEGWDNLFRLRFKYLLPIGQGRDTIINTYVLDRGLLISGATGGTSWNPFTSGRTYLEFAPFYRWQQLDTNGDQDVDLKTNGFDFSLFRDNRDFYANPSTGSGLRLMFSRDFGWFDSSNSWTVVQGELDKYFSLGSSDWFRQRVIALNFWTAYSPSWDEQEDGDIDNGPPAYAGATLGGLWRLRGYPSQRFSDKAAIYYATEYRMIPKWNPFTEWPSVQKHLGVQWLQYVPFVEVGRVAPEWGGSRLHSDMKWCAGFGLRAFLKGLTIRIDTAVSDEQVGVQMMVAQPFQF
jgi:hypothetical protein